MLLDILISLVIIPMIWQNQLNFDGFLALDDSPVAINQNLVPQRVYTDVLNVQITAQSAIAIDAQTGKILYKKNSQDIRSMASITKLMTALVFIDNNPGWQEEITIKSSDQRNGGIVHLNTGEIISLQDLFYITLIASDNGAAVTLARATGLTEEEFVKKMNDKAEQIGLVNTQFVEPTGLNRKNVATVEDIVKLLNLALKNNHITNATSLASYEFEVKRLETVRFIKIRNTDWLVDSYLNVIGGKTGHLESAGYSLTVKISGEQAQEIIVAVLGSATNYDRFQDVKAISDWLYTNYKWRPINN